MAVLVALGSFVMTLVGGWTAHHVTDRPTWCSDSPAA
jgi:ZIP family zinc transporter